MMVAHNELHGLGLTKPRRRFNGSGRGARATSATRVTGGPLFTDPKLNAMREAAIAGNWKKLFQIAPRGCWRAGDRGITRSDDTYGHCAEPEAYGGRDVADLPEGRRDYAYWEGRNPLRKKLTINTLRFKKDANGRVVKVPYTKAELRDYYENFLLSRRTWLCAESQIERYINTAFSGSHPVYPVGLCDQTSRARRRKVLKNVAIAAAAVTGAVMFGPAILSKAGAVLSGSGTAGAAATGAAATGAAGGAVGAIGSAGKLAAATLPKAVKIINGVNTVKALKDGKMPPPPISIGDGNFSDYAGLVAKELAQREMGKRATQAEQQMLAQYVEAERRRLASAEAPHLPVVNSGLHPTLTAAQKDRADAALSDSNLLKVAAIGIPATLLLARAISP